MLILTAPAGMLAADQLRGQTRPTRSMTRKSRRKGDTPDDVPDEITGRQVGQLLRDLAALSGQEAGNRPALELLIGDILTRTQVAPEGQDLYLCVTGLLPPGPVHGSPAAVVAAALDEDERAGFELLWHAEQGRCIAVRRIALRQLVDERGVMDAILDTADMARRCALAVGAA